MAQKGSQFRAEANPALRTVCAHCGKSIPTEVGHPHPLDAEDRGVWRETWGLVGVENGSPKVFPTCDEGYRAGWRPPGYVHLSRKQIPFPPLDSLRLFVTQKCHHRKEGSARLS